MDRCCALAIGHIDADLFHYSGLLLDLPQIFYPMVELIIK